MVNILDFGDHTVSVQTTQLCHFSKKGDVGDTETNEHSCSPVKLYLQKQAAN